MKTPTRTVRAALLALVAIAACASTASAAGLKYDAGYGIKTIEPPGGVLKRLTATQCHAISNKLFAITGVVGGTGRVNSKAIQKIAVAVVNQKGQYDSWLRPHSERGEELVASDFAANGDFAYVEKPVLDKRSTTFVVRKSNYNKGGDRKWNDVTIKLPRLAKSFPAASVNVLNLRGGDVLVVIDRTDGQWIYRFTASGKPANFGTDGVVKNAAVSSLAWYLPTKAATPLLETYDGSLIVAASGRPGQTTSGKAIGLLKLDSHGSVIDVFGDKGLWLPPTTLAEEKPLAAGQTREGPQTMSVIGGTGVGKPLTVLFATTLSSDLGRASLVATTQLSADLGVARGLSTSIDHATDAGDGGFPDAVPFAFEQVKRPGIVYAAAWSQDERVNTAATFGKIVGLNTSLTSEPTEKSFIVNSRFKAEDFAPTPDGRFVYACGARATNSGKAKVGWSAYSPALRRFRL